MKHPIFITKASGEKSEFSEERLRHSLERAGADATQVNSIVEEIASKLYDGIETKKIYRMAFKLLRTNSRHTAARYHLKRAIMELGPSGFPFEKYFAGLLTHQGYRTKTGQLVKGKCVTHEIDVLAENDHSIHVIECKYHNQPGIFCDVKVPLYIHSRFNDVEAAWSKQGAHPQKKHQGWVVTNTRFSKDAIQYGTCAGLNLVGWDWPLNKGIKDQVDALGLYPITCLTSLTKLEKQRLLDKNIVMCLELLENEKLLSIAGITFPRIKTVMQEIRQLCQHINVSNNSGR